eukprot:scaffold769_cov178-Ochromonas_danica.AAC.15
MDYFGSNSILLYQYHSRQYILLSVSSLLLGIKHNLKAAAVVPSSKNSTEHQPFRRKCLTAAVRGVSAHHLIAITKASNHPTSEDYKYSKPTDLREPRNISPAL